MVKVRVYEVARELGLDNRELVSFIASIGIQVRNHMSALEPVEVALIKRWFAELREREVDAKRRPTVARQRAELPSVEQTTTVHRPVTSVETSTTRSQPLKVRVYEVARELGLDNRELVSFIASVGIQVRNHMSALEPAEVGMIKGWFADLRKREAEAKSRATAVRQKAAAAPLEQPTLGTHEERLSTTSKAAVPPSKPKRGGADVATSSPPHSGQESGRDVFVAGVLRDNRSPPNGNASRGSSLLDVNHGRIFLSYRRSDSAWEAGAIYDWLIRAFGRRSVFKDIDSIPLGVDFKRHIEDAVYQCTVQLVLIGRDWLDSHDSRGRRLDQPDDFVRLEVEAALERNILVIPVLMGDAAAPPADKLPASLAPLARRQGMNVHPPPHFERDMKRLVSHLRRHVDPRNVDR